MHGVAIDRVRKRRDLPGTDMSRENEHAFPASLRLQKIFLPFDFDDLLDVAAVVLRKTCELDRLPAKVTAHITNRLAALFVIPLRKRQSQIKLSGLP